MLAVAGDQCFLEAYDRKAKSSSGGWLGVTGMYALLNAADRREVRMGGPPSRLASLGNWLAGR